MPETFKRLEQRLQKALDQKNYHEMQSDMLSETLKKLEAENAALKAKIADYESGWRSCMDDNAEEQHCTCVPALKIKIESLQAENAALRAMLKRLQWAAENYEEPACPICWCEEPIHEDDCALAALLNAERRG